MFVHRWKYFLSFSGTLHLWEEQSLRFMLRAAQYGLKQGNIDSKINNCWHCVEMNNNKYMDINFFHINNVGRMWLTCSFSLKASCVLPQTRSQFDCRPFTGPLKCISWTWETLPYDRYQQTRGVFVFANGGPVSPCVSCHFSSSGTQTGSQMREVTPRDCGNCRLSRENGSVNIFSQNECIHRLFFLRPLLKDKKRTLSALYVIIFIFCCGKSVHSIICLLRL